MRLQSANESLAIFLFIFAHDPGRGAGANAGEQIEGAQIKGETGMVGQHVSRRQLCIADGPADENLSMSWVICTPFGVPVEPEV